jgi:hypothetical protein
MVSSIVDRTNQYYLTQLLNDFSNLGEVVGGASLIYIILDNRNTAGKGADADRGMMDNTVRERMLSKATCMGKVTGMSTSLIAVLKSVQGQSAFKRMVFFLLNAMRDDVGRKPDCTHRGQPNVRNDGGTKLREAASALFPMINDQLHLPPGTRPDVIVAGVSPRCNFDLSGMARQVGIKWPGNGRDGSGQQESQVVEEGYRRAI